MGAALALAQAIPPHRERLAPPKRPLTLVSSGTSAPPESSIGSTTHHQAERATPKLQLVPPRESGRSIDPLVDGDVSRELLSLLSSVPQTESPFGFVEVPERCVQQQFDEETGLYYLRNRYMNPALGKFIQKDPAGYGAGPNLYAYCNCDPINHSDPSGLDVDGNGTPIGEGTLTSDPNEIARGGAAPGTGVTNVQVRNAPVVRPSNMEEEQPGPNPSLLTIGTTVGAFVLATTKTSNDPERGTVDEAGRRRPWKPFPSEMHIDTKPDWVKDDRTFVTWTRMVGENLGKNNRFYVNPNEGNTFLNYAQQFGVNVVSNGPHAEPWDITHWHIGTSRIHFPVQPGYTDPRAPAEYGTGDQ